MRYCLLLILFFNCFFAKGQTTYAKLTREALETMWKAKDEESYRKAFTMYEEAFSMYPDSIDATGLYKASVLASTLKEYDKAFKYLGWLATKNVYEDGYAGWNHVVGKYAEGEYKNLLSDARWNVLKLKATKDKEEFYKDLKGRENEFYSVNTQELSVSNTSENLYKKIKSTAIYKTKKHQDYSLSFKINDSTQTSFFVHLPASYNPEKKYSVLFFLHGAVRHNALVDYQLASWNLGGWNRFYTKYADQNDVILVFPRANKQYNWMTSDDGFFMVSEMAKCLKSALNVDDNKVFISGHSNGATGSFSYLMKQPGFFAGFYGFNTYPKVFTGGTFVENIKNRSFINFSTDEDYYYPPNANDDFTQLMKDLNADYQEKRYEGFPHWFPQFDESESAYEMIFKDLKSRERNPFPKEISWEFDDEKYGNIDWLSDLKLDTTKTKSDWHFEHNFKITKWLEYDKNDSLITEDVDKYAFDFPRKSGKIKVSYKDNVFTAETSRVGAFTLNISPEMVNLKKNVKVYVNGKLYFNDKVNYDKAFMLSNFEKNKDRRQIWVNSITLDL